ncbi:MAG: hypothetical protein K1000chlam3_00421 [Chlamydiae bacterium]|nr:hypothetical protein [Chlamydiota bacterium]
MSNSTIQFNEDIPKTLTEIQQTLTNLGDKEKEFINRMQSCIQLIQVGNLYESGHTLYDNKYNNFLLNEQNRNILKSIILIFNKRAAVVLKKDNAIDLTSLFCPPYDSRCTIVRSFSIQNLEKIKSEQKIKSKL